MKVNACIVFLLATTLGLAVSAVPMHERAPKATDINDFLKDSLSGEPERKICKHSDLEEADGTQNKTPGPEGRTCSTTQLGEIPDITSMPSTLIIEPQNGQVIRAGQPFDIKFLVTNMELGNFDNPDTEYNSFGQQLTREGLIKGHSHITIQDLGDGKRPPNAEIVDSFFGVNQKGINGLLTVNVPGLKRGLKRICTMSGSFSHQALVMPVAQRGSQDDCIRLFVK